EKGEKIPQPSYEELTIEKREIKPHLIFTITDESGNFIRKIIKQASKGIQRVTWDLKDQGTAPVTLKDNKFNPEMKTKGGFPVVPGKYFVSVSLYHNDEIKDLVEPVGFDVEVLNNTTLPAKNRKELAQFEQKTLQLSRVIQGTQKYAEELVKRIEFVKQAIYQTPSAPPELSTYANDLGNQVDDILFQFKGQKPKASAEEIPPSKVSINSRLSVLLYTHWRSTSGVTGNQKKAFNILMEEFPPIQEKLKQISEVELKGLEDEIELQGAPWTPGRLPTLNIKD
ncbi:hypothetical protein MNBD_IGNAVI01-539, partial [hydrothermal vent metagenome]